MPVVTPSDIAAGAKTLWDAEPPQLVPGGLHYERPAAGAVMPYAVTTVEEGDSEEFSGKTYLQKFTLRIAAYSNTPMPNAGPIRLQIEELFRRSSRLKVPHADQVLHVRPVGGELKVEPQQKDAQDVIVASGAWEVLVQATRK